MPGISKRIHLLIIDTILQMEAKIPSEYFQGSTAKQVHLKIIPLNYHLKIPMAIRFLPFTKTGKDLYGSVLQVESAVSILQQKHGSTILTIQIILKALVTSGPTLFVKIPEVI